MGSLAEGVVLNFDVLLASLLTLLRLDFLSITSVCFLRLLRKKRRAKTAVMIITTTKINEIVAIKHKTYLPVNEERSRLMLERKDEKESSSCSEPGMPERN